MSNYTDKYPFKPKILDKSLQSNSLKRAECFTDKNTGLESSFLSNMSSFASALPRQSTVNSLFKVPALDRVPVKKATGKSIRSPQMRVQAGGVNKDLKSSQQPKMSLIPRPSFINSRKSLRGSRCTQINARKELIKKMVFLAECTLKENKEIKQSTPVKALAGLTPKKTPRSGGYFILPEFKKKSAKLEDIRSPIENLIKKEMFSYSAKPTPLALKVDVISPVKPVKPKEEDLSGVTAIYKKENKSPCSRFTAILRQCKMYNTEVSSIFEKLKVLDDSFESELKNLPDYKVYNKFLFYQLKKEDLYKDLQTLEKDFRNFVSAHTNVGCELKAYVEKKQKFFEKQVSLHKDFERAVETALEKCKRNEEEKKTLEEDKPKAETPQVRRSLRLSKIKKNKSEEKTPGTKKLKKLDSKSKGIQKSKKIRSP